MNIEIDVADYLDPQQGQHIAALMDCYARDPMGGGEPLPAAVLDNLAAELAKLPHAFTVLATVDGVAAGLINCFTAFSTFKCKPLINIHDVIVHPDFRGRGLSLRLLDKVEQLAIDKGCCKLTLEVLEGNTLAQSAYKHFGFAGYELDPATGGALFWQKAL